MDHLLVHCQWVPSLWHLSVFDGGLLGPAVPCERCVGGLEEEHEEESWSLENGSFDYLVGYLEGENLRIFENKAMSFQDFKFYVFENVV